MVVRHAACHSTAITGNGTYELPFYFSKCLHGNLPRPSVYIRIVYNRLKMLYIT
jgi:hypothetical protein